MNRAKRDLLAHIRDHHRKGAGGDFTPGVTRVLSSGAVLDEDDVAALAEGALDMRVACGNGARRFERALAAVLGLPWVCLTNSGSSANLLALSALTSPDLGDRRLRPGDEVITVAAGFPTTVNPIIQNGLIPVFVDVDLGTYNTTMDRIKAAAGPRTRAIMIAHALGNPFPVAAVADFARSREMYLIEDNCDALGSRHQGTLTGTFGDLSTVSFYPAHHITMGEGGCVATATGELARIVRAQRDGYGLWVSDIQARLGLSQLVKLPHFGQARRRNWWLLRRGLECVPGLLLPRASHDSDPSWFGFAITVSEDAPFSRHELVEFLERRQIGTRRLFAGNLTRHPAYIGQPYRIEGSLANSDIITERTFWIGVYPGISLEMIDYVISSFHEFADGYRATAGSAHAVAT